MAKKRTSAFTCRSCQAKIKVLLEPGKIKCDSCSQVYQILYKEGKLSIKALKPKVLTKGPSQVSKKASSRKSSKIVRREKQASDQQTKPKLTSLVALSGIGALLVGVAIFTMNWQPVQELKAGSDADKKADLAQNSPDSNTHGDFEKVKVIFEENCVSCHGAERQKGKFRMDTLAEVLKGGSSGPALVKGNAKDSLLYELVSLHADDEDRMPSDDDPLSKDQQALIKNWIEAGAPWEGTLVAREKVEKVETELVESPFIDQDLDLSKPENQTIASQHIDLLIEKDLKAKGQKVGALISEENFVRRAFLDISGRIPTLKEYEDYFSPETPGNRHTLVDELMDSPGYVSTSHTYWLDALRVKAKVGKNSFSGYKNWILQSIKKNMPYDQFAYELVAAEGRIDDPTMGAAGYYLRDDNLGFMAEDSLSNTMQLFLATDMLCAQCHDHPYKKWTQKDFYKLLAFTNGTLVKGTAINRKETRYMQAILKPPTTPIKNGYNGYYKAIYRGAFKGGTGRINLPSDYKYDDAQPNELIKAQVPFGHPVNIDYDNPVTSSKFDFIEHVKKDKNEDVRARMHLAKWIASPDNPMFTKTIVNRLWGRVFGSPLVGNNLDMKESDMGDNPNLTHFLIEVMKLAKYDQKVFMKILYKTQSYQRTAIDRDMNKYYHPAPVIKRLTAEQVWDSLLAIRQKDPDRGVMQGTLNTSNVVFHEMERMTQDERVEFIRHGGKSKKEASKKYDTVAGVTLSSKSHRASMLRHDKTVGTFLDIYGNSGRGLIDDAIQEATIPQALHLMNDGLYLKMTQSRRATSFLHDKLKESEKESAEVKMKHVYNAVLTRHPTPSETELVLEHFEGEQGFDASALAWALMNSHEFKIKQ